MYFANIRNKFGFSFFVFAVVLLFVISITFGSVSTSASSTGEHNQEDISTYKVQQDKPTLGNPTETEQFNFLTNDAVNFAGGNNNALTLLNLQPNQSEEIADSPVFKQFDAWVGSYASNGFRADDGQLSYGEDLAVQRERLLKKLIQIDPQAALGKAIPAETLELLPSFIAEHSEKRISAYGDFLVSIFCGREQSDERAEQSRTEHEVVVGDSKYQAFVYGRRASMTTKFDIPLQGIAVDGVMAVDESLKRIVALPKSGARRKSKLSEDTVAAEIGGKTVTFSNQTELDNFVDEQIAWESKIGAVRPKADSAKANLAPVETDTMSTVGPKTILFMRVDFPDRLGAPLDYNFQSLDLGRAQDLYNNQVNQFYKDNSYGQTSLQVTVTSQILRMPHPQTYYTQVDTQGDRLKEMEDDARNAARQKGYETDNFDFDVVGFSFTRDFNWSGQSLVGAKGSLLNGGFFLREAAHELGHNYGLLHANLWRTTGGSPIGSGTDIDYGDCYDDMGDYIDAFQGIPCNSGLLAHFNAQYKRQLNWLTDNNVRTVTSSGDYTIIAEDLSAPGGIRALKIRKDATKNYWIEYRQLFADNPNAVNGALIRWDYSSQVFHQTQLLDMNPATATTDDAPLTIGHSFTDNESGNDNKITITVKGKDANGNLVVHVELGETDCTYALSPSESPYFSARGGSDNIIVTTGNKCPWTVTNNNYWVSVNGGNFTGTGSGTISYSVQSNLSAERTGTITVANQIFTVNQLKGNCGYPANPSPINVAADGGNLDYSTLNPVFRCGTLTPAADGTSSWINIDNSPPTAAPNTGAARSGTLKLVGNDSNNSPVAIIIPVEQTGQTPVRRKKILLSPLALGN